MQYIVHTRFKDECIGGYMNIPALTVCDETNGLITYNGKPVCYATSENGHRHFSINNDGCGIKRGKLVKAITKTLSKRDEKYQARWNKIWADDICRKYKRLEHPNDWLWNNDFYTAEINTLKYIANLIGIKEE